VPNDTVSAIEICPGALSVVDVVSRKIASAPAGAALFIDYGENYSQSDTLRGFRKHKQEHVLSRPGQCDITADVDFSAVRAAAQYGTLKSQLSVVGPASQVRRSICLTKCFI
jgi:NADH dehydrogenase [ubiquinone] 1 alpha subcomplex assembly factor 7